MPIIKQAITKLIKLGHVKQIHKGEWLSKPLLAPKPHQENITDINDFILRFCVNYIPLNSITKVISMHIPCCDEAVRNTFDGSKYKWLMGAVSGFNQICVAKSSQAKLAFTGPCCSRYTYLVMPFGPVNGSVIFIIFIHDLDHTWKEVLRSHSIDIDRGTNTTLIVNNIFSWAPTFDIAIEYLKCHLDVCISQNLSVSLKKSLLFPT